MEIRVIVPNFVRIDDRYLDIINYPLFVLVQILLVNCNDWNLFKICPRFFRTHFLLEELPRVPDQGQHQQCVESTVVFRGRARAQSAELSSPASLSAMWQQPQLPSSGTWRVTSHSIGP